ncbi:hypothetical protein [Carboxylicivirga sp. RSCT41]|uniref:hypothetical protein n=1 Tax=Carboxylicivirga agarovorans TaxID=3417570 RepID=UPI003D32FAB1
MAQFEANIRIDQSELIKDTKSLVDLTNKELLRIYNRSLAKASIQTVVKEARRDLKKFLSFSEDSTGATAKSLGVKSAKKSPLVLIGGRTGRYDSQLIHILDSGTTDRTTKGGRYTGKVIGLDFYSSALRSKSTDLQSKFVDFLYQNYTKSVIKKIDK